MEGVTRIIWRPELVQAKLISSRKQKEISNAENESRILEDIANEINPVVEKVISKNDPNNSIQLCAFYSNLFITYIFRGRNGCKKNLTLCIFPNYGEEVEYVLKKGDFFAKQSQDPLVIVESCQDKPRNYGGILLFRKDPFKNMKDYEHIDYIFVENPDDII